MIHAPVIHIDFETFYDGDYTLRKMTNESYVRDERFQVLGVGVRVGDGPAVWLEEWDFRAWSKRVDWAKVAVNAHHAQFDGFVLSERYGIRPGGWFCTMSMARALHNRVGLEELAQVYGIGAKGHELESVKGKRREHLTQAEWVAFGGYCRNDVNLSATLLSLMLPTFPAAEVELVDMTVRMFTEPVFRADLEVLTKALNKERERKAVFLDLLEEQTGSAENARAALASSDKFAALLRGVGVEPPLKRNNKGENIYAFAKTDPGMAALLESPDERVRFLCEARLAVKSTIVETRTERMIGIGQRGPVPFYLKFCGAHTHRWSGGDKMNPQNFNRGGALRDAIIVEPGYVIVVVDSGQIEARKVAWLAGETKLLETFRRNDAKTATFKAAFDREAGGRELSKDDEKAIVRALAERGIEDGDFYSDVGGDFFGKKLSKKETPKERQLSKSMILGLGFEMGWAKFGGELLKGLLGADPVQFTREDARKYGVDVVEFQHRQHGKLTCGEWVKKIVSRLDYGDLLTHCAVADFFVRRYRATNTRIAQTWRACDGLISAMDLGTPMTFRGLTVERHALRKPSGLALRYPGLRRGADGWSYMGGKGGRERAKIYGGLLTENIVQSLARDVVAEQALRIQAEGIHIATTTHDEVVAVVPEADGPAALEVMLREMRRAPEWCRDLPLNADGGIGRRYGDAK